MAANARASLNTLLQRLHVGAPSYDCSQDGGTAQGWTCVLTCPAIPADRTGSGVGRPEETFTATESSKKEGCARTASQALQLLASCGIQPQTESSDTLLDTVHQATKVTP